MTKYHLTPLNPGDTVGLISLAAPVKKDQIKNGLSFLEHHKFSYKFSQHAFSDFGLTAAPIQKRLKDLETFLRDDQIKALWSLRGGYGSIQLLGELNYRFFEAHPRLIIGFSDLTVFQWALYQQIEIPTLSGLTLTMQMSENNPFVATGFEIMSGKRSRISANDISTPLQINRGGKAEGIILGGTLSMICSLCGTPFWPENRKIILFLEDVNEPLYRIDRYFHQLSLTGFWPQVEGIILGKFLYEDQYLNVLPLLVPLIPENIPIISNFPYGHVVTSMPLPIGAEATLRTNPFELSWVEFIVRR